MKPVVAIFAALVLSTLTLSGCAMIPTAQGVFEGQRAEADDAAAKNDVLSAKVAIVSALIADGSLPTWDQLDHYGFVPSPDVDFSFSGTGDQFCVQATSKSGATFHATDSSDLTEGSCP